MATIPRSFVAIAGMTLLVLGLVRIALVVGNDPVLGYGERPDMHRITGCIGVMPVVSATKSGALPRPFATYFTSGFKPSGCYPSSAAIIAVPVVIAYAIASIASDEPEILIPLRAFGAFNLLLFGVLAVALAMALRAHPAASFAHGALFFLLVCDPVATLWLDTLCTEPAILLGAYGTITMTAVILLSREECRVQWWLLGASLVVLGLAREQFGYLPLVLTAIATPALLRRSRRRAKMLLVIAVVVAAAQLALAPLRPGSTASIDRANMYLGVIVPAARDEATTLSRLGLPARCAQMTGTNGWSPGTGRIEGACPDVAELSAFQFLALVPAEPLTLARAVSRVLPAAEAIVPGYLAISPDGAVATVYDLPPQTMSFVALLLGVPSIVFAAAMVVLLLAFPGFLLWMLWSVRSEPEGSALPTVFVMLVAIGGYTLATTALGTGLPGAERNNWLGALATLAGILLLPAAMWQLTTDLLRARIALAAAFGVCLLAIGWILWSQSQPLAIGALEKLSEATGHKLEIGGFALDPWGVRRVYATVGGGPQTDGVRGIERRDVALVYPGYPDASGGGFQITIPPNKWREAQQLKIYVESRTGALTEIDRRPIRLAP